MDMTGERRIPAPREQVWSALNDPEVLRGCIPGCDTFERTGPDSYKAAAGVKIGPIAARFSGTVTITDAEPPSGCTITGDGQAGVAGSAKGSARVHLADDAGTTVLTYEVGAEAGGRIAELGDPLIDAAAKLMADQFFDSLTRAVTGEPAQRPAASTGAPALAPAPVLAAAPPVAAPSSLSGMLAQIPPEIFGLPIVAWIGIAIFLPIFFLIFSAYL
jgi:carbon monoxide dehydrogenase subunit G